MDNNNKQDLKSKKCTVNISLSCYVKEILLKSSVEHGMSMSAYITYLVLEDLKKRKNF